MHDPESLPIQHIKCGGWGLVPVSDTKSHTVLLRCTACQDVIEVRTQTWREWSAEDYKGNADDPVQTRRSYLEGDPRPVSRRGFHR